MNASSNVVAEAADNTNPLSLLLVIFPLLTVFGNALVICAVFRDRNLQTVTNFLIVSLAVSDLLIASCVMSFAIYFEWNAFVWDLGPELCKLYIGTDVACSTASILNLMAISLDRYVAISHPLAYVQYGSRSGRALVPIGLVWIISLGVASPVFLGANQIDGQKFECEFTNAYFIIISSIFSFFLPCTAMIVLYTVIFSRLRQRERARFLRHPNTQQLSRAESDHISTALWSGAQVAHHVGKHLKRCGDQLYQEYSYPTVTYPTLSLTPSSSIDNFGSSLSISTDPNGIPLPNPHTRLKLSQSGPLPSEPLIAPPPPPPDIQLFSSKSSSSSDEDENIAVVRPPSPIVDPIGLTDEHSFPSAATISARSFGDAFAELFPFIDGGSDSDTESTTKKRRRGDMKTVRINWKSEDFGAEEIKSKSEFMETPESPPNQQNNETKPKQNGTIPSKLRRSRRLVRRTSLKSVFSLPTVPSEALRLPRRSITTAQLAETVPKNGNTSNGPVFFAILNGFWRSNTIGSFGTKKDNSKSFSWSRSSLTTNQSRSDIFHRLLWGIRSRTKPSRHLVKKASKQLKREQKATITLAIVLAVFLGCWVPFFTFHLSNALCLIAHRTHCVHFTVMFLTTWLGYINSSLNPLIYTVFDHRFRRAFRSILRC